MLPKECLAGETAVSSVVNVSHCRVSTDPAEDLTVPPGVGRDAPCADGLPDQGGCVDVQGRSWNFFLRRGLCTTTTSTATFPLAALLRLPGSHEPGGQVEHVPRCRRALTTPHGQLEVKVGVHREVSAEGRVLVT